MKVHEFYEDSLDITVSFASDETQSQNPDDYAKLAFQPLTMWPGVVDIDELKKKIAVAGVWQTQQQVIKEQTKNNPQLVEMLAALIGTSSFDAAELAPQEINPS